MTTMAVKQLNIANPQRRAEAQRVSHALLTTVERLAGIGGWDWDIANDRLTWSDEVYRIVGRDAQSFPPTIANFMSIVHPDDLELVKDSLAATLQHNVPYDLEFRIVRPDNTERSVHSRAEPTLDQAGRVVCLTGTVHDITERKTAERLANEELCRIQTQSEVIGKIGQSEALMSGDVEALARQVTELAARAVGCERVSVWLFDDAETELRCIALFEATPGRHSSGVTISQKDFSNEFAVLKASGYVSADDALTDPRVKGYVEPYLKPVGITAMLDAAIQASGRHLGMVCFAHVGRPHHWTRDEIAFARQLGDKIGLAIISRLRRQAEAEFKKSEEKYRDLVESTADYVWQVDQDGRYTYVSPVVQSLLGHEPADFLGKSWFDHIIMPPAEIERLSPVYHRIVATRAPFTQLEYIGLHKNGRQVVLEASGVPIFDKSGAFVGYRGIDRDVTERKTAERLAHDELIRTQNQREIIGQIGQAETLMSGDVEALARQITELSAGAIGCERVNVWLFNEAETELHCIDLFEATPARHSSGMMLSEADFGDEIAVLKASKYVAADDPLTDPRTKGYVETYLKPLGITSMLDAVIQASGRHFGLLCFEHVNTSHRWTWDEITFASQLADKIGLAIISRLRRQAEEEVARSEEKYRNLVESTTDYIWEIDRDGCYTYVSPAVRALLGHEPQDLLGKSPFDHMLMPPEEARRVSAVFARFTANRAPFSQIENLNQHKDGRQVVLESSGVPIFDKSGAFVGYRGIDRDVTERNKAEASLRQRDALLHAVAVSTREFVTGTSLDEAMPKALELVCRTMHAERMTVLEGPETAAAVPVLRYLWHVPEIENLLDRGFFARPYLTSPGFTAWRAPLLEGAIVTANERSATGEIKAMLDSIGTKSLLLVPIMIDGKYWGQIGLESCSAERVWADFEIEILQTLGELIGSSIRRERYVNEIANANQIVLNTPTILYRLRGDPSLPMEYVSQNIRMFGYEPVELTESPHFYRNLVHPDDAATASDAMAQVFDEGFQRGVCEFRLLTGRGDYRWVEDRFAAIRDPAGRLTELEGLLIDITERKAAEAKIMHLARTDQLTGLANRATFFERLRQAFASSRRGASAFALLSLDIDRFKDINDTLGHPVGDQLLMTVGERLRASVRESDIVARLGGDEFAILQFDLTDRSDAGALAIKIRKSLAEPVIVCGNELRITASIGISTYAPETAAPEDMLAQADVALYRAKEEGRDQYRFHTQELDVQVREQVILTEDLAGALCRGEFELHYKPQIELAGGSVVGMEAHIRWHHPTRGLLMPRAFLSTAEKSGAITAIGQWVIETACRQMSLWREAGTAPPTLAVNISYADIKRGEEFVQFVTDTLAKWRVAPGELELDVTESMLARADLVQNDVLERLQKLGIRISIDDFGTKCSTFDYLSTYHVNRIKISQPLIDASTREPAGAATVRAIVAMARELGIEVIKSGRYEA
jgi:diguanylate cyclase (GGDEF)-like protein/PAS domain S-box-containing protein